MTTRENEPTQIAHAENVFNWDHSQIEKAFSHLDPADAYKMAQNYAKAATEWDQGLETFKRSVGNSIAEAWEGSAAEAAKNSIKQYTDHAADLTDLLAALSTDIDQAGTTIVNTKKSIPPAAAHSWTANIWPPRAAEEERSRSKVTSDSRDAMQQHYVAGFGGFDRSVPVLPPAPNPTNPGDGRPVDWPGGPTGPNGPNNPGPNDGGQWDPGSQTPGKDGKDDQNGKDPAQDSGSGTQPTSNSPISSPTSPSSVNPGAGVSPAGLDTTGLQTTPSGVSAGGLHPGGPGTSGGGLGSTSGGPGRSVAGVGVPGTAQNSATALGRGTASPGAPGMPGMGMGGAGKGKDEQERTHKTADYLVNAENAAELIGELPKAIPGGVIGGDVHDDGARG
ncbi:WXG100 family type VII secretion target [Nocardia sp. BSTN01]|uniref:WXG100 family type VII secretion target n=1 Tax=Nocardia sp. BSTN01 TaxID=2783665 RepID=UPI00188F56C2|nr:WXG100 family type VII secretion target [Nocardia sp. BSTN01]MBF4999774.1 WXG100 family type VII secretion target [Nocardia sp. BSTN01]